jgi:hypothetical protein
VLLKNDRVIELLQPHSLADVETDFDLQSDARLLRELASIWAGQGQVDSVPLLGADVRHLAAVERRLRQAGRWVSGPSSLFEVLQATFDEVRNCRVVRWLLDPLAPHGLGAETLRRFLGDLSASEGMAQQVFDSPEDAVLVVEESRADTRADLVIYGPAGRSSWRRRCEPESRTIRGHAWRSIGRARRTFS